VLTRYGSTGYEQLQLHTAQLDTLPTEIADLEDTISRLQASAEPQSADPEQNLSLAATNALLDQRDQELTSLDVEIERLQAALPAKKAEVQRLQDELAPVQLRKIKALEEADEAKRRRADGGRADELEEKGRWLRGVEGALKGMLEV
jgi:chromosome segregation ATPase